MEEKIEDILDNNMMYDGQLNKTKAITELLNLFSASQQSEMLKFADWLDDRKLAVKHIGAVNLLDEYNNL